MTGKMKYSVRNELNIWYLVLFHTNNHLRQWIDDDDDDGRKPRKIWPKKETRKSPPAIVDVLVTSPSQPASSQ